MTENEQTPGITRYPLDWATRSALREAHTIRAVRASMHVGQSARCAADDHATVMDNGTRTGCANDGSNCLCWCHDHDLEDSDGDPVSEIGGVDGSPS